MYISNNSNNSSNNSKNLGRYTKGSLGGYSGLGNVWGEKRTLGNTKSPSQLIRDVRAASRLGQQPIVNFDDPMDDMKYTLPPSIADDDNTITITDPKDFIPKPRKVINAFEAMKYLKRPAGARGGSRNKTKGKVYWTPRGPQVTQKPLATGKTAEKVPPPIINLKPNVKLVRDLPVIPGLEPVEVPELPKDVAARLQADAKIAAQAQPKDTSLKGYFGEMAKSWWPILIVLCLLILILGSYNRA